VRINWNSASCPRGQAIASAGFLALNTNSITNSSTHPNEAWEVLKWLGNRDTSYTLATQQVGSNMPNFREDTYCDPRFSPKSMDAICKGAEVPEPDALIWNLRFDEFNRLLTTRMNEVRDAKAEPNAGWLNALRADLQAILDLPRDTGFGGGHQPSGVLTRSSNRILQLIPLKAGHKAPPDDRC
jgi:hypothetical protein